MLAEAPAAPAHGEALPFGYEGIVVAKTYKHIHSLFLLGKDSPHGLCKITPIIFTFGKIAGSQGRLRYHVFCSTK